LSLEGVVVAVVCAQAIAILAEAESGDRCGCRACCLFAIPTWRHTFICCGTGMLQVRVDTAAIIGALAVMAM
jgi:hypothetical protein